MAALVTIWAAILLVALVAYLLCPADKRDQDGETLGLPKWRAVAAAAWFAAVVAFLLVSRASDDMQTCATGTVTTVSADGATAESSTDCTPLIDLADAALLLLPAVALVMPLFSEFGFAGFSGKVRDLARKESKVTAARVVAEHRTVAAAAGSLDPETLDELPPGPD